MYAEEAVLRLDLVRTLRDAGVGIGDPRARAVAGLRAVEGHVAVQQLVAAAPRAALRSEPNEDDRRICAVTRLTAEERRSVIERFHALVTALQGQTGPAWSQAEWDWLLAALG